MGQFADTRKQAFIAATWRIKKDVIDRELKLEVLEKEHLSQASSGNVLISAQPNVLAAAPETPLMSLKMWVMTLITGAGAGVTSGLLMRLLRLTQHLSFS